MQRRKHILLGGSALIAVLALAAMTSVGHLVPGDRALPPMAATQFCIRYPDDCAKTGGDGKETSKFVKLTPERRTQLKEVNTSVNQSIVPQPQDATAATTNWLISPQSGDCGDYVVTKRHELLAMGWPSGTLLLSEVVLRSGEHHLILVARTNVGDFVMDNLTQAVRTVAVAKSDYKWVRIESSDNPEFWNKIRERI